MLGLAVAAQPTPHSTPESRQKAKAKADYAQFRREITNLKEFADEKSKIGALQKENKMKVQVVATIDSLETDDTKTTQLTGYITQVMGDNTANAYEIKFDRNTRKIVSVKRTTEAMEPEAARKAPAKKATGAHPAPHKKDGDDDGDDDEKSSGSKEKEEE